jgi:hypothetical protein
MVGDYTSSSVVNGKAIAIFAIGKTPTNGQAFEEAMYTAGGLTVAGGPVRSVTGPVHKAPAHPRGQRPADGLTQDRGHARRTTTHQP